MNKGILVVVSAPSGCGKDTIVSKVSEIMKGECHTSISKTTRPMRMGEEDGVNYYFVSKEEFESNIANGEILEYTVYNGNYYGTPVSEVTDNLQKGKVVFLVIEVEGGENIKKLFPDACKIFIIPPSFEALEKRLRNRGTEEEEVVINRLLTAKEEIKRVSEYDYVVENDDLDEAVEDVITIIKAERLKYKNMKNKVSEVIENA